MRVSEMGGGVTADGILMISKGAKFSENRCVSIAD